MISVSINIQQSLEKVFHAFADLQRWKQVLPDVLDIVILYNSGSHQEFLMTVERPSGSETVRGIRFCTENKSIELFQPQPPPNFRKMTGLWTFTGDKESTTVIAERWFELDLSTSLNQKEKLAVQENTVKNLTRFLNQNLVLFQKNLERK